MSEYNLGDMDMSLFEEMKVEDIRSYVQCKYDIDTARRIFELLKLNDTNNDKIQTS